MTGDTVNVVVFRVRDTHQDQRVRVRRVVGRPLIARTTALTAVVQALADAGIEAEDIGLRRPTLDEVFLRLTGRPAGDAAAPQGTGQEAAA